MTFSLIGEDTTTGQAVYLYQKYRIEGLTVVGLQRMGKSGLFEEFILSDIKQGIGVCVLDPHGELVESVRARLDKSHERDVIFLDLLDTAFPFGINILECSDPTSDDRITETVNQVTHVFEKAFRVSPQATPRIYDYLFNSAYVLIANPGHTLIDIPLLFNEASRQKLLGNVPSYDVLKFWRDFKQLPQQKQDEEARELLRRLNDLSHAPLRNIAGQSRSTIDVLDIMDEAKILLVKLNRQQEQATSLIGSILVALLLNASNARNPKRPFHLYADEFQNFATEDFAILLEQAGKRNIGVAMAFQNLSQLELSDTQADKNLKNRTLSVGNIIVFRSSTNTHELAEQFDRSPQPAWEEEIEKEWVEVLEEEWEEEVAPEWHERIEDVIDDGVEPIPTPVSNPFDWFQSHAHEDPVIKRFVDHHSKNMYVALSRQEDIRAEWNRLFYRAMTSPNPLTVLCEKETFRLLLWLNINYPIGKYYFGLTVPVDVPFGKRMFSYGFSPYTKSGVVFSLPDFLEIGRYSSSADETMAKLIADMIRATDNSQFQRSSSQFADLAQRKLKKRIEEYLPAYQKALGENGAEISRINVFVNFYESTKGNSPYPLYVPEETQRCQQELQRIMTEERAQFETFIKEFRDFILALAKPENRIETGSGLYRPRKRTQVHYLTHPRKTLVHPRQTLTHPRKTIMHPQRTVADMQNDIANQLRGLPKFTARVKTTDANGFLVEHTIQTIKPGTGIFGIVLQERKEKIQQQNCKDGYIKDRASVKAEIAQRQAHFNLQGSQPQPGKQPQGRKMLVCQTCGANNSQGAKFCNQCGEKL